MKIITSILMGYAIITAAAQTVYASNHQRTQLTGVGMQALVATGYGLYAVTMRANSSPGAISSFYLYSQNGTYPARWHEIDIEFTPGFTALAKTADSNHPHYLAKGKCYSQSATDNLPSKKDCAITFFDNPNNAGKKAGSNISFNTYNYRAIDGQPYAHSNDQVFMPTNSHNDVFKHFHTYYIYYTPQGIYWTKDLPPKKLTVNPPQKLPQPVFVKKDFHTVNNNGTWNNPIGLAFQYDSLPLTPKLANGDIAPTGAPMYISMNLWDGSNTDPQHRQDWGGETNPRVGSSSAYKYVAYYPLTTPIADVSNNPTQLQYGKAIIYSDFTTKQGTFLLNNQPTTFTNLWQVSNGSYIWPLGQLDPRNLKCGNGELIMQISNNYPNQRPNYQQFTHCPWLNNN